MPTVIGALKGIVIPLFSNAKSGLSNPVAIPATCKNVNIYLRANAIPTGNLLIEESVDPLSTYTWSVAQTIDMSKITDNVEQIVHLNGTFSVIRLNIPVALGGSNSITASLVCT